MNSKEFISEVKSLTETSSWTDIKKYLLYDVKQEMNNQKKRITKSSEKILKETNIYSDDLNMLNYQYTNDISVENIKNWLRYKIMSPFNLNIINFDGDKTELVKGVLKELLLDCSKIKNVTCTDKFIIETSDEKIFLETDTMNSFQTTFKIFMNYFLSKNKYDLIKTPDGCTQKVFNSYRNIYFLTMIEQWYQNASKEEKVVLDKLVVFTRIGHTIGNFILVPNGYNQKRVPKTNDYWDLTLQNLKDISLIDNYDLNYKWYTKNYNLFFLNTYYEFEDLNNVTMALNNPKLFFQKHSFNHKKPVINEENGFKEFSECVDSINKFIILRGIDIITYLNPKLKENKNLNKVIRDIKNNKPLLEVIGE